MGAHAPRANVFVTCEDIAVAIDEGNIDGISHGAWLAVTECIRRESEDEPPRWLAIGWLPDGRSVELVAVELIRGWLIIHALSPVQKKFWQEIERARQRGR